MLGQVMEHFIDWIRSILFLYFLLMIMLYLSAGSSYKKYIRFFMGLVLVLKIVTPVLSATGQIQTLQNGIAYEQFWQGMEEAQVDFGDLETKEEAIYLARYEQAVEQQFMKEAEDLLLDISDIEVRLNDTYGIEQVDIQEGLMGDGAEFARHLKKVYGLEDGQVRCR